MVNLSTKELNTAFEKKIENLSTDLLIKRKKFSMLILAILVCISLLAIITVLRTGNYNTLWYVVLLLGVSIPMINGLKKINTELTKRNESEQANPTE